MQITLISRKLYAPLPNLLPLPPLTFRMQASPDHILHTKIFQTYSQYDIGVIEISNMFSDFILILFSSNFERIFLPEIFGLLFQRKLKSNPDN